MDTSPGPTALQKSTSHIVYIFNMSEDVWPFISSISDSNARAAEVLENIYLADLRLFQFAGENNDLLFIAPHTISKEFLDYFKDLCDVRSISVLTTAQHSGVICEDILHEESIMNALIEAANSSRRLVLIS
jgi:hypothetical protein